MLSHWLQMLLVLLSEAWSTRRDAQIRFLQVQVELLKKRIPGDRVILSPAERNRLLKLGEEMQHQVDDLIGIVTVKTYRRWFREAGAGRQPGRVGCPRKVTASLRALILRLARENIGWGARRIVGELRKLAVPVSRTSVRRVLTEEGILPDPDRHAPRGVVTPWRTFIDAHTNVMVATDFFCKAVWTPFGKRLAYVLVFIHLGSRKITLSPATFHPTNEWMQQQARNTLMWIEEEGLGSKFLIHDHDTKFTAAFDELFRQVGTIRVTTPYQAPIANCYAESWIGSFKRECLNHLLCFSLGQLDFITAAYAHYHNYLRPHQGLDNVPPGAVGRSPPCPTGHIGRQRILGGLLNHYCRKAA